MEETNISLEDIQFIINYIDMTVARGSLRGEEILEVGKRREKFIKFLNFAQEQIKQNQENNQQPQNNESE